jgi:predicted branched-subunit amino acid permease
MLLTNLNFSLICNTRATTPELILYELILFAEIIYEGNLTLLFIGNLEGKPKDYSILLISIMIANQVLIMDLVFRAAYEDREREE